MTALIATYLSHLSGGVDTHESARVIVDGRREDDV